GLLRTLEIDATTEPPPTAASHLNGIGTWIAMGASGAAAISLAFLTLVNALTAGTNPGLTLPQREARRALAEQVLRRQGISISVPLPSSGAYGIDWAGIVTPAVISVLLVALTVLLWRATRVPRA